MPPILYFYIFLTSLILCTILIPFVSRLSVRIGGVDTPDERKIHTQATPRLGGIAIFASLLFTVIFYLDINQQLKGLLSGAIVIFLTGLADDLVILTPRRKFAGEFMAAGIAVILGGIVVRHIGNPFGTGIIELGALAMPFTILGIVGLSNAINLMDGLDGLAGGVCAIACVSFATISYTSGNQTLLPLVIAVLGALLGFLRFNNYPAKIFMGDCGSLLLGYLMGVFSVMLAGGGVRPVSPYVPLMILGVPILDTLVVMFNRRRRGKPLFLPDKSHLHHRLLDLGIGHRYTVLTVLGVTYLLNMFAIIGCNLKNSPVCSLSDTSLVLLLSGTLVAMYLALHYLTSRNWPQNSGLSSNQSLRSATFYRRLAGLSGKLALLIKFQIVAVLMLPVFLPLDRFSGSFFVMFLVILPASLAAYISLRRWRIQLLQCYIYTLAFLLVFITENHGRTSEVFGIPLLSISHFLIFTLLMTAGYKIFLRKRVAHLIVTPFEYLIMFLLLCTPLLPYYLTEQLHLMSVCAKSVIIFIGFKLILMRNMKRNRKILLAVTVASLVIMIRHLFRI